MCATLVERSQAGFSLVVVMVTALLATLLVLTTARTVLLDEAATGNESDYQRAFEGAQELLRDAESEIQREDASLIAADSNDRHGYPSSRAELLALQATLGALTPSCAAGLCIPDGIPARFWSDRAALETMKKVAVSRSQGWYWVELLPYDTSAATAGGEAERLAPDADQPYIYRITAVAKGRKPTTQAVIQSTLVRKKQRS
jgi:type IV pilus assembly protein PilX